MIFDYVIHHEKTHKDVRGEWRAITYVSLMPDYNIRILTTKRPSDSALATLVRVTKGGEEFNGRRDFYKEMKRIPGPQKIITRDECNLLHYTAVRDIASLVNEVARHYGIS